MESNKKVEGEVVEMISRIVSMFNVIRNLISIKNCGIIIIALVMVTPNIPLIKVYLQLRQYDEVKAKIIDIFFVSTLTDDLQPLTEDEVLKSAFSHARGPAYIEKVTKVEYYVKGEYKSQVIMEYHTDEIGEEITVYVNQMTGNIKARTKFLFCYTEPVFYFGVIFFLIGQTLEFLEKREYENYKNAKMALKIQKEIDLEEVVGKRNVNIINDETYFDKLCINNLQRSIPVEINWILCKGDLSRFDSSFLWKQDGKIYEFISETLRLQREGLPQDYLVFQITGDMCFAINFDDNQVYSFVTDKLEEPLLQGNFLHFLKKFYENNK